ncbi:alpha/beta hydrolase family protein [Amycolatopsis sp. YIM 10]|uniref:alpha/beta hydrolase n=1 Tax=Amycolatopsis sp. YIM 10 TaxID=2653857 RepID=UPI0012A89956|nr:alpha/beta hydrolase-fold protein [Amycolatopsis sp. YIM 10]QFU92358.1 Putative esterase [Amycolatopsis sp. YIM 10]
MSGKGISRRALLLGGGALAAAACAPSEPADPPATSVAPPVVPAPPTPAGPVTVDRVFSAARGAELDLVLITPEGVPAAELPVCLALHGRGSSAKTFVDLGLPSKLTEAVRAGMPPFTVAAVDGANYWIAVDESDDPQRMLNGELPEWLTRRGLGLRTGGVPSAVMGISMGAFGALRYARDHRALRAAAAVSPALFVGWGDARSRKVFRDRAQWESHEPLLHADETAPVPVGVWCGTQDPFAGAARRYIQAARPAVSRLSPGGHTEKYWKSVLPDVLRFIGERIG